MLMTADVVELHPPVVVGIDPGINGGVAKVNLQGELIQVWDMPLYIAAGKTRRAAVVSPHKLVRILRGPPEVSGVLVEKVWGRQAESGRESFRFGDSYGVVRSVPVARGLKVRAVTTQKWRTWVGWTAPAGLSKREKEDYARELAADWWPELAYRFDRAKDKHAGRAEAALIALAGVRAHDELFGTRDSRIGDQ